MDAIYAKEPKMGGSFPCASHHKNLVLLALLFLAGVLRWEHGLKASCVTCFVASSKRPFTKIAQGFASSFQN